MDAEYRIHTLEPAIYTGFAGRYRVPRIESSDVGRDAASVHAVFGKKTGKYHYTGRFALSA
jgi:hypothetical protein